MPLHPQVRGILDARAARAAAAELAVDPEAPAGLGLVLAARREYDAATPMLSGPPEPVASVRDATVDRPGGPLPVRIYTPEGAEKAGVVVFLHGGGWIVGSLASHDALCRVLANAASATIVSVDYRLAPEHRFPAAAEDAWAALEWTWGNAETLCGRAGAVAVAGDSAGGNLAAVVAQRARQAGGPRLKAQALIYPALDAACDTESYERYGEGYGLTRQEMEECWELYLGEGDGEDPAASPLRATDVSGVAPALVMLAEYDPLRDEGELYAERLARAGVPVELHTREGMAHGFVRWLGLVDTARESVRGVGASLRTLLRG